MSLYGPLLLPCWQVWSCMRPWARYEPELQKMVKKEQAERKSPGDLNRNRLMALNFCINRKAISYDRHEPYQRAYGSNWRGRRPCRHRRSGRTEPHQTDQG